MYIGTDSAFLLPALDRRREKGKKRERERRVGVAMMVTHGRCGGRGESTQLPRFYPSRTDTRTWLVYRPVPNRHDSQRFEIR